MFLHQLLYLRERSFLKNDPSPDLLTSVNSLDLFYFLSSFTSTRPSTYPIYYLSIYLSIYPSIHPSINKSTYLPTYLPTYLIDQSIYLPTYQSIYLSIYLSICIYLPINQFVFLLPSFHSVNITKIKTNKIRSYSRICLVETWCITIILPLVLHGCETWSLTLRIFGPKREEMGGGKVVPMLD